MHRRYESRRLNANGRALDSGEYPYRFCGTGGVELRIVYGSIANALLTTLMPDLTIQSISACPEKLTEVIGLGRQNSRTLGHMPKGAFEEYAQKDRILLSLTDSGELSGYLLYRISRGEAKIAHLCVDPSARHSGVATALVNELRSDLSHLYAISLTCRRDYVSANALWAKLGFSPVEDLPGRAKGGSELTRWRMDLGHPDLFSDCLGDEKIVVTVDSCILFSRYDENDSRHADSIALWADWLADEMSIRATSEVLSDIDRSPDANVREDTKRRVQEFISEPSELGFETHENRLLELWPESKPLSASDQSDVRHLAKAITYESDVFVTLDDTILGLADIIESEYSMRILEPLEFIIEIDEIRRSSEYQPARLAGSSNFGFRKPTATELPKLTKKFLDFNSRERKSEFDAVVRTLLHDLENGDIRVVHDDKDLTALVGYVVSDGALEIRVVRTAKHSLGPTLLRYLISWCVRRAAETKTLCVRLTESSSPDELGRAAEELGFTRKEGLHVKTILPAIESPEVLSEKLRNTDEFFPGSCIYLSSVAQSLIDAVANENAVVLSDIEHRLWPAKILCETIPTFLVPIKSHWAMHLFDFPLADGELFGNKEEVATRPENVYYRSALNDGGLCAPARILWYVSRGNRGDGPGEVRACSRLNLVDVGPTNTLFRRYRRLGVYDWNDVRSIPTNKSSGNIMALRFDDTELSTRPYDLADLKGLLRKHNCRSSLQSPTKLPINAFEELYRGAFSVA